MKDLRIFLNSRRNELLETIKPLEAEIAAKQRQLDTFRKELADIDRAASAIGMVNGLRQPTPSEKSKPTIKEAALSVLRRNPAGLAALDILRQINEQFQMSIVRSSLSPQLSRLKADKLIRQDGIVWLISKNKGSESRDSEPD